MSIKALALGSSLALALLLSCGGIADGASFPVRGGVVHACVSVKGKAASRGSLRVVPSARRCKKRRGERAISWNVFGLGGSPGASGPAAAQGPPGPAGAQGPTGQVDATILKTIEDQAAQIKALSAMVDGLSLKLASAEATLGTGLASLEGTVTGVCSQVSGIAAQVNKVAANVGEIKLLNLLSLGGLSLSIPPAPTPLATACP